MNEKWPRLETGRATTRTQQTHQRARMIRALPTLRLSKGAVMWRGCSRGNPREIEKPKLNGEARAPTFRCWPLRSKFASRPSLSSPNISGYFDPRFILVQNFKLGRLQSPRYRCSPLIAGKIRALSSAMSMDRSVFSFRSARGSASASRKIRPALQRASARMARAARTSYR